MSTSIIPSPADLFLRLGWDACSSTRVSNLRSDRDWYMGRRLLTYLAVSFCTTSRAPPSSPTTTRNPSLPKPRSRKATVSRAASRGP